MKTTIKQIKEIFKSNNIPLSDVSHDLKAVKLAVNHMVECTNIDDAKDIVNLVFFNEPITKLYTHSYGFHTRQGREIIETFKSNYYNLIN
jgi:hypothetical protein